MGRRREKAVGEGGEREGGEREGGEREGGEREGERESREEGREESDKHHRVTSSWYYSQWCNTGTVHSADLSYSSCRSLVHSTVCTS